MLQSVTRCVLHIANKNIKSVLNKKITHQNLIITFAAVKLITVEVTLIMKGAVITSVLPGKIEHVPKWKLIRHQRRHFVL